MIYAGTIFHHITDNPYYVVYDGNYMSVEFCFHNHRSAIYTFPMYKEIIKIDDRAQMTLTGLINLYDGGLSKMRIYERNHRISIKYKAIKDSRDSEHIAGFEYYIKQRSYNINGIELIDEEYTL